MHTTFRQSFPASNYNLDATLSSGQAFRWSRGAEGWSGPIGTRWVRLLGDPEGISAETPAPPGDWQWLSDYLQLGVDIRGITRSFPPHTALNNAVERCRGLRLLRQDPWECLASFILSSTKQIVQIRQIIDLLARRYGEPILTPAGYPQAYAFPSAERVSVLSERDLRECKMGFRAPYLLETARRVAEGFSLGRVYDLDLEDARGQLMELPGVGRKIADCVLLFAYGFPQAFPIDVWMAKALRDLCFPRRRLSPVQLQKLAGTSFGPHPGFAQQYLFHYVRTCPEALPRSRPRSRGRKEANAPTKPTPQAPLYHQANQ
jgi:N-glycosylase/DNA lyase